MSRLRLVFTLFCLWFVIVAARLFYWQIILHTQLAQAASQQHLYRLEVPAKRGEILTADGSPLVTNQSAFLVFAEPKKIASKSPFIKKVSEILHADEASIASQINQSQYWVPLKQKVDEQTVSTLKSLHLEGIGFESGSKRYYPEGSMSSQLLGFVGSSYDGQARGYFGLEGYYERVLRGRTGFLQQAKDALGKPILAGFTQKIDTENGAVLKLYLDRSIQFFVEKKLHEGIEKYGAKGGTVTIMNPTDGGILAAAAYPSYDPSNYQDYPDLVHKNPIVAESYEPGSTFKVVVMASALNESVITPETIIDEPGPISVGGFTIKTWNNKYNGNITTTEVLEKSSNVGMVVIGQKLGRDKLLSYIKNFGFGQETGIDLDDETSPSLRPDKDWKEIDLATATFGQGIAVTPIQMVRAVGVIANGGVMYRPHAVKSIITQDQGEVILKSEPVRQIVTNKTTKTLTEMMVYSVDKGEARYAKPKGYRIAGKTGTAQIPIAGHYDSTKTIASFIGFAPADKPRFIMLVTLREPSSSPWGSETAAPLFFSIAKDLFTYWGIAPSN